jgi:hypothetical protein
MLIRRRKVPLEHAAQSIFLLISYLVPRIVSRSRVESESALGEIKIGREKVLHCDEIVVVQKIHAQSRRFNFRALFI